MSYGVGQLDLWYSDDFENEDQNAGGLTQFACLIKMTIDGIFWLFFPSCLTYWCEKYAKMAWPYDM